MTSGEYLIQKLGLKELPNARIARVIDGAYRVFLIYVDSSSPQTIITKNRLKMFMPKVGVYKFPFVDRGSDEIDRTTALTPLLDLKLFNGNLAPGDFILIDLAGRYERQSRFIWEGRISEFKKEFSEEVFLKDFKNFGMSALTTGFRNDRNLAGQQEVKTAKLVQVDLNPQGSVTFSWLTEPTELASPVTRGRKIPPNRVKYPGGKHAPKEVDPTHDFKIIDNPSRTYTLQIELVDFMKWLDTYPHKDEIVSSDMKDIFDVSAIKLWNSSPSWHWQGMNAIMTKLDGAIYPTDKMPKVWNQPDRHGEIYFLDKHTYGLLANISFWYGPMSQMLTKKLRDNGILPK